MARITIHADCADADSLAEYVAFVATQIRDGYTSGHVDADRHWDGDDIPD